jgi:hypothetical protein
MNAISGSNELGDGVEMEQFLRQAVTQWSALCQQFLDRQRSEILERQASPEELAQHRAALKWLIRFARAIYLTACDPDYPDRRVADELKGRMVQLEHSWRIIHEKMPEAEAEQFLRDVFPG